MLMGFVNSVPDAIDPKALQRRGNWPESLLQCTVLGRPLLRLATAWNPFRSWRARARGLLRCSNIDHPNLSAKSVPDL